MVVFSPQSLKILMGLAFFLFFQFLDQVNLDQDCHPNKNQLNGAEKDP